MNWTAYEVPSRDLHALRDNNQAIPVPSGKLPDNAGVEVFSIDYRLNAVYDAAIGAIRKINTANPQFKGLPNRDLALYNDHLLNPNITTLIVDGLFGTGKTSSVCAHLVPGLERALKGGKGIGMAYISKPHEALGKSYGHLPGDIHEKTMQEFKSYTQYFDRFGQPMLADMLMGSAPAQGGKPIQPMLEIMPFEYLRGRDIDSGWVILDETQNTSEKEVATFVARVGDGAKLILLGDSSPFQIDKAGNNTSKNGLTYVKDALIGTKYTGEVELRTLSHIIRGQRVRDIAKYMISREEARK